MYFVSNVFELVYSKNRKKIHLAPELVRQGAGESGPQDPRTLGPHFRLYSELRSAIKNALTREDPEFFAMMVRLYDTARNHFAIEPEND